MLLKLLKRDLRLHWDALALPYVILALAMGSVGLSNGGAAMVGTISIGVLFIPFLPMALHLREQHQGTLGDVIALPASRASLVTLRYVEALLFALAMLIIGHLGSWFALSATAHTFVPMAFMDRSGALVIGLLMLICFAYPMPFTLRWDGKGLAAAFILLMTGFVGLGMLLPTSRAAAMAGAMNRFFLHLMTHPGQMALGFLTAFILSYRLALIAIEARDF